MGAASCSLWGRVCPLAAPVPHEEEECLFLKQRLLGSSQLQWRDGVWVTILVLMALAQPASSHWVGSSSVISSSSILGGGCGKRCEAVSPAGSQAGLFLASQRLGMAGPPPSLPSGRPTALPSPPFTPWRFELHSIHMQWETLNGRRELGVGEMDPMFISPFPLLS